MSSDRRDFLVTGTDTGIGKTVASVALLHALRERGLDVAGMKPIASGCARTPAGLRNDDALALRAAGTHKWPYPTINPYAFEPAIAPHLAAAEAGVEVRLEVIRQAFDELVQGSDAVVVEGAGGFLVPLNPRESFADLARELGLEVVVVVGLRLGCLNHALLTAEAVLRRNLPLAGWIGSHVDPDFDRLEQNIDWLRRTMPSPCLGIIPHQQPPDPAVGARALTPPGYSTVA